MDEGLVPPCLELGRAEHAALRYMSRKTGRRGTVPLDRDTLVQRLSGSPTWLSDAGAVLTHLEDGGYVRKVDGEGFEVLRPCFEESHSPPEKKVGEDPQTSSGASGAQYYGAQRLYGASSLSDRREDRRASIGIEALASSNSNWLMRRSNVRSPVPGLVSDFFNTAVEHGLMHRFEIDRTGLGQNLKFWLEDGVTVDTVREMITEFVQHPEWVRRSKRSAWLVFVSRRRDLFGIVTRRPTRNKDWLRNDPSPTRHKDWLGRHTPPSYSPS